MCEPFEPQIKACSRKSSCSRQQVLRRLTRIVALQGKEPEWCTACEGLAHGNGWADHPPWRLDEELAPISLSCNGGR